MTPGYGTIVCQPGIALIAVICVNYVSAKHKRRNILGYAVGKTAFYGILGSIALIVNIIVQIYLFRIPFRGSLMIAFILSILLAFAVSGLSVAVSAWIKNRLVAMVLIGLLIIPNSIMAGYTWPVLSMVPLYQKTAFIIPFYHYGDNIRNLFLNGNLENVMGDIWFLILFTLSMIMIATAGIYTWLYIKPKEVIKK